MGANADQHAEFRLDRARGSWRRRAAAASAANSDRTIADVSLGSCSVFNVSGVRWKTKIGRSRQRMTTCWPGSILLISRSTGPPAASVEASGFIWAMSGTRPSRRRPPRRPCRWRYRGNRGATVPPGARCLPRVDVTARHDRAFLQAYGSPRLYLRCTAQSIRCDRVRPLPAPGWLQAFRKRRPASSRARRGRSAPGPAPPPHRRRRHRACAPPTRPSRVSRSAVRNSPRSGTFARIFAASAMAARSCGLREYRIDDHRMAGGNDAARLVGERRHRRAR